MKRTRQAASLEEVRIVDTPAGMLTYMLVRKRVKNLNLRVKAGGRICLSVPLGCPLERADQMIEERCHWIFTALSRMEECDVPLLPACSRQEALLRLSAAVDRIYPLVHPFGVVYPQIKVRKMRSQWGNCHWAQGYITLNVALVRCPEHLRDYVALHELVHFLHHDHGPDFYRKMDELMPDWKMFRNELKQYAAALEL